MLLIAGPIGAASAGSFMKITPRDSEQLHQQILKASRDGKPGVTIAPGTYRLAPREGEKNPLRPLKLKDFVIDATGVTLVFTDPRVSSIVFDQCERVTLRGVTMLRDPVPFSQGEIIAVSADRGAIDVRVEAGYPADAGDPRYFPQTGGVEIFDRATRLRKPDTIAVHFDRIERIGAGEFRFVVSPALPPDMPVAPGDLITWRGVHCNDIMLHRCAGMVLEDVTIKSGSGLVIHEMDGEGGNRLTRVKITRGPAPAGAPTPPLRSTNADAFHSSNQRRGPILEDCLFEDMGDDGVNIHGSGALVCEAKGEALIVDSRRMPFYRPGDPLRLYNRQGELVGEGRVRGVELLKNYKPPQPPPPEMRMFRNVAAAKYYEITLENALPLAEPGCMAVNPNACGAGFVIRNCIIRNNRAQAVVLKGNDGLVENCTFENNTNTAIVVAPDVSFWNEPDFTHRLVIRNNTIRRAGVYRRPDLFKAGSLTIAGCEPNTTPGAYVKRRQHRDILIENTLIECNDGPNVLLTSAEGVVLRGNRFVRPMQSPSRRGERHGIPPGILVQIRHCSDVRLEGNTVEAPGAAFERLIDLIDADKVTGAESGLTLR
jgi:hypothetical protein